MLFSLYQTIPLEGSDKQARTLSRQVPSRSIHQWQSSQSGSSVIDWRALTAQIQGCGPKRTSPVVCDLLLASFCLILTKKTKPEQKNKNTKTLISYDRNPFPNNLFLMLQVRGRGWPPNKPEVRTQRHHSSFACLWTKDFKLGSQLRTHSQKWLDRLHLKNILQCMTGDSLLGEISTASFWSRCLKALCGHCKHASIRFHIQGAQMCGRLTFQKVADVSSGDLIDAISRRPNHRRPLK